MITNGQKISIRYRIITEEGIEAANNLNDAEPQHIFIGRGQLMLALEAQLREMKPGEQKQIKLSAEDAFGITKPEFVKQTRLSKIPEKDRKVGNILDMEDAEGNICSARVHAIEANNVILDFNHPLAGQAVTFDIELVSIND